MIPFIEDYLTELIETRIQFFTENPEAISGLLGLSEERIGELCYYLRNNRLLIKRGYPLEPTELPCICILLAGEEEVQSGLSDLSGETQEPIMNYTENYTVEMRGNIPTISVRNVPVIEVNSVTTLNSEPIPFHISDSYKGVIELYSHLISPGDIVTIDFKAKNSITSVLENLYDLNYKVEIWTQNGDLTIELYHLIKCILIMGRDWLNVRGLTRQKLSGTDLKPAPSFFPEFVYRRGVSLWCQSFVSIPNLLDVDYYINAIQVDEKLISEQGEEVPYE